MTLQEFTEVLNAIMTFCWELLSKKIILGTYSLWNVFTGIFAIWAFNYVFVQGILDRQNSGVHYASKGFHFDKRGKYKKD